MNEDLKIAIILNVRTPTGQETHRMKTRLMTFLASAYVTAMLASSLTPVRARATLASAIDPDVAVWLAAAAAATPAPELPLPAMIRNSPKAAEAEPVMTEELMARLIKYTRDTQERSTIAPTLCQPLGLCDGTAPMTVQLISSDIDHHLFALPLATDSKDVIIAVDVPGTTIVYLTDKTGILRAAVQSDAKGGTRLILNEKAAAGFKAEMMQFAKEASALPPTGGTTRVAQG